MAVTASGTEGLTYNTWTVYAGIDDFSIVAIKWKAI